MNIGYYVRNYANERNIIGKVEGARYAKIYDLYEIPRYSIMAMNRAFRRKLYDPTDFSFTHSGKGLGRVDLIHFFNAVSFGKVPWISTFETIVPRLKATLNALHGSRSLSEELARDPGVRAAIDAMSSPSCRALIAMSRCNLAMQLEFLKIFPREAATIRDKLHQLYPPQTPLIHEYEEKTLPDGYLHLMFVGSSFFRKGGLEILEALSEIRQNGPQNLRLTIVSSMSIDSYATQERETDIQRVKALIRANQSWIRLYGHLPNHRVVEMMKSAHIGLLPTHADTFGYSVLEFQASGCPVISTNVRALSEINNDRVGWVIDVPRNRYGEALYTTAEERRELSRKIRQGLIDTVRNILGDPEQIREKSNRALKNIQNQHSPLCFGERLSRIYGAALAA